MVELCRPRRRPEPLRHHRDDVVDEYDGVVSLREAISYYLEAQAAGTLPDGAKVVFDPNVFTAENHTIVLNANTSFNFDASIVVDATNLGFNVVLDASASNQPIFDISGSSADVTLAGLTIENATFGLFSSYSAIRVSSQATLTLSECRISNTSGFLAGGIVVNNSTLIVEKSYFDGNRVSFGGGGAIKSQNYSNITVSNTVFTGNFGISMGAVDLSYSTGTFTNCEFLDNSALLYGAAVGVDNHSSANIIGGKIAGNSANAGGVVYVDDTSSVNLTDVAFESNSPADLGGDGTITTTETASAALLDDAFVELDEEIELFF